MVSLFCECCSQLKDFTFFIERVYFLSASTSNLNSSIGEEYNKDEAFFDCVFRGGSYLRDQYVSAPFNLGFYFSAYADYSIERAKTPLYMNYLDNGDFEYKIGSDFITPLGKEKINNLPLASEISSFVSKELFFPNDDRSDYFYFFIPVFFDFTKYTSLFSFTDFSCYTSPSPFFVSDFRLGLANSYYSGIHTKAFNIFSILSDLVNRSLVYEIDNFIPIFSEALYYFYSKFFISVTNFDFLRSYFSVYRFSKKDYYAYLQNYAAARQ